MASPAFDFFSLWYFDFQEDAAVNIQKYSFYGLWPLVLLVAAFASSHEVSIWASYPAFYACFLLFAFSLGFARFLCAPSNDRSNFERNNIAALLVLFLLPLICYVGSNNPVFFQCYTAVSPWLLALAAVAYSLPESALAKFQRALILVGAATLMVFQFISGYVFKPYLLYGDKLSQNLSASDIPQLKGLLLSHKSHAFLATVSSILEGNGFKKGQQILALYNLPGVVYAVGGRSPYLAWWLPSAEFRRANLTSFTKIRNEGKQKLFLLLSWDPGPETIAQLHEAGVDYPLKFKCIGSVQMAPYKDGMGQTDCGAVDRFLNGEVRIYKEE